MRITKQTIPQVALKELTNRITRYRMELGLTQAQLAAGAGVCKRTIERIENGGDIQLSTFIRLLYALELTDRLNELLPEENTSPIEMLKSKTKPRKRVRKSSKDKPSSQWKWGDEK